MTIPELRLRAALRALTAGFILFALAAFVSEAVTIGVMPPGLVAAWVVTAGLLAGLCGLASADVRRFSAMVSLAEVGAAISVIASIPLLGRAGSISRVSLFGQEFSAKTFLLVACGVQLAVGVLLAVLHSRARRARFSPWYLSPSAFETVAALADVLIAGDHELLAPEEIARNVDGYLASFQAHRKWLVKAALSGLYFWPLLSLRPPLPLMAPAERSEFVQKRFFLDVAAHRIGRLRRMLTQAMIRVAQQMVFLGYYGDPRTFDSVGYLPFSKRARFAEVMKQVEPRRPTLTTLRPDDVGGTIDTDVVVVGTGAAGAILASRLAEAGRHVLMIERGAHVDPSEFTENEVEMMSRLYGDGALQLSRDFRFQVVQGMCVGGSTVVNNGVCFDTPDRVIEEWNRSEGLDGGVDEDGLRRSLGRVRDWLHVQPQTDAVVQRGGALFAEGVRRLGLDSPERFGIVEANIAGCIGSGNCGIGCAYGKKLSMLDTVLPEAQGRYGADRFAILPQCRAERVLTRNRRAQGLACRLADGRTVTVRARTVVIAAGAINSSLLLMRSRLGGPMVGRHLCFNIASGMTADFEERLDAHDGLQLTHYLESAAGFVLETWHNPVATQALSMPGWFGDHFENMRRYAHTTSTGVLTPSGRQGRVRRTLLGESDVDFEPTAAELSRIVEGLKLAGRIYLAAGARRVMPATFRFLEFSTQAQLERLGEYVRDGSDINLVSGHPQGGNAMSRDPEKGVVDSGFRVNGFAGLYVCDASVFPSSLGINPQLTVMALADLAAQSIE